MPTDWARAKARFDHTAVPRLIRDHWAGVAASARFISQDYNIVYRFEGGGGGYYLRICHESLHPLPKARQVLRFLRYLARADVPVGAPVPAVSGAYIVTLGDGYYAAAQREAPGSNMERHLRDISVYGAWGRSLGQLHAASRHYQPDANIPYTLPTVQGFWLNIEPTVQRATPEIQRIYAELSDWMARLPLRDYGLIHGDYRPGNVIWDGATARAIDFDEPNYHWYIADVSRALLELFPLPIAERRRFRRAFLRGYLSAHAIDERWISQLPYFAQQRALLMYAWDLQEGVSGSWALGWALEKVGW